MRLGARVARFRRGEADVERLIAADLRRLSPNEVAGMTARQGRAQLPSWRPRRRPTSPRDAEAQRSRWRTLAGQPVFITLALPAAADRRLLAAGAGQVRHRQQPVPAGPERGHPDRRQRRHHVRHRHRRHRPVDPQRHHPGRGVRREGAPDDPRRRRHGRSTSRPTRRRRRHPRGARRGAGRRARSSARSTGCWSAYMRIPPMLATLGTLGRRPGRGAAAPEGRQRGHLRARARSPTATSSPASRTWW